MFWISFDMTVKQYYCEYIVLECTTYFSLISIHWIFHRIGNPAVILNTLLYIIDVNATVTTCKLYVVIDNLFMRNCMSNIYSGWECSI